MNGILDRFEKGDKFALYTGRVRRAGSNRPHAPVVLHEVAPGEVPGHAVLPDHGRREVLFKDFDKLEEATKVGYDNILDIIAMGFDRS